LLCQNISRIKGHYDRSHKMVVSYLANFTKKSMKKAIFIMVGLAVWMLSCRREPENYLPVDDADTIMTIDSAASGILQVSPDSIDTIPTVDSTAYDMDSIINSD